MNSEKLKQVNITFNHFIDSFEKLKKNQHSNSVDQSITASEVHLIVSIGDHQPINLVTLSAIQHVSRSAITQSIKRMLSKNLVKLENLKSNEKNKYLRLTNKGRAIYDSHQYQQNYIETEILSVLQRYSNEDIETVLSLMSQIEQVWNNLPW